MQSNMRLKKYIGNNITLDKGSIIEIVILSCFFIGLLMSVENYLLFHSAVEIFSSVIALVIFIIAVNTYVISKSDFFMVLGIGYFWVGIIDLIHMASYPGVGIIKQDSLNMSVQFWIVARYLGAITILIYCILIYKPIIRIRPYLTFFIYSFISTALIISILYFKIFPICYIEGQGLTDFKIISEYFIAGIYILSIIFFSKNKKKMDNQLFTYMTLSTFFSGISEVFFANYISSTDWIIIAGHILKVISFYCLYKGVVEIGLKRPYTSLFYKIDNMDSNLKYKIMELEFTDEMLKEESIKRKDIEKMLISNEKCYEILVKNSKDAVVVHSNGKCLFANDGAARIFGIDKTEDLIGMRISKFLHPDDESTIMHRTKKVVETKGSAPLAQFKIIQANGEVKDVEAGAVYFAYKGQPASLCTIRDISHIKEVDTLKKDIKLAKEFNSVLTEFFTNISHELKTPLNVILAAVQVLEMPSEARQQDEFEVKLKRYLKAMKQNCYRLLRLVNNLIDQSKVDAGYLRSNFRNLDIISVVENITLSVADYVEKDGVELIFDTDTEEKIMAFDADKIERIMLNLLSNAVKFTNQGDQIFVNINDKDDKILITVRDTGIGIPEDKLYLIFDRFGQVDKSLTRNKEGSGIGLSLVKSLVEMHGGSISVNSMLDMGSEFVIELPVRIMEKENVVVDNNAYQSNVERISIEFSDIYN
jgi:PAS domain S-box-containing protein